MNDIVYIHIVEGQPRRSPDEQGGVAVVQEHQGALAGSEEFASCLTHVSRW